MSFDENLSFKVRVEWGLKNGSFIQDRKKYVKIYVVYWQNLIDMVKLTEVNITKGMVL